MVLQKRLDYGFNGHQVPFVPRAPRSIRKRGSTSRKKSDENSMCSIDILATIAGKILQEGDISTNSSNIIIKNDLSAFVSPKVEIERPKDETRRTGETFDQGKCEDMIIKQNQDHVYKTLKDSPLSVLTTSRGGSDKEITGKCNDFALKVEGGSCENMSIGTKSGGLFHSEDHIGCDPFPHYGDHVKLVSSRDDDENSSGCTHPIATTTTSKLFRAPPRIGDRRIRKVLASKNWKPKLASRVKEEDTSNTSGELNPIYRIRKTCYKGQRSQQNYPFKKRRLFGSMCDNRRGNSGGGISCSLEKGVNRNCFNPGSKVYGTGLPTSAARQNILRSRDSHVKLRIKSVRVPELFIEISETATVGSLKRRVMEAVMNILGGGLRVGVLVQGKNVRDDNKTLLQTGISRDNQPDALGFALEPNSSQALNTPSLLDAPEPLTRYLPPSEIDVLPRDLSMGKLTTYTESDHDSASSPSNMSIVKNTTESKAIVPVQAINAEALSVVPMHWKSKQSDASQRRIRRPFSVSEVEALVHAVEKLGTGRWRDVKLRAFDNAKHRTYVDLKDKWKTLVHTARISPQQRRGEPVPQELLDRVLSVHAYWAQHQAKLQLKNRSETCLLL